MARCRGQCRVGIIHSLIFHRRSINVKTGNVRDVLTVFPTMIYRLVTGEKIRACPARLDRQSETSKEMKLVYLFLSRDDGKLCNLYGLLSITGNFFATINRIDTDSVPLRWWQEKR